MKTSKKVLSVLMALAILVNVFAVFSSAMAPDTAIDLTLGVDKAVYAPGDTVTVTIYEETADDITKLGFNGNYPIAYDSSVIQTIGDVDNLDAYNIVALQPGYDSTISGVFPIDSSAIDAANNWNAGFMLSLADDATTYAVTSKVPVLTFQVKIADNAPNGDTVIGINRGSFESYEAYVNGYFGITGAESGVNQTNTYACGTVTIHIGTPAPAGPAVTKAKSQVKMTATSATTVADEFSFRVISKISDSDWDTYFKNTGVADAATDYITAVGMVAYKGAAAFNAETAKEVVAGALVADYAAAKTDYISKVSDTADAEFGAIIKANHSKLGNDVTYMGFVQYVDASGNPQTIFYETAGTAALSTNYDNIVNAYLKAYPFAA